MGRRFSVIRGTRLNLHLPEDVRAKLDLHLFSDVEAKVPEGAYSKFIAGLIKEKLEPVPAVLIGDNDQLCPTCQQPFRNHECP